MKNAFPRKKLVSIVLALVFVLGYADLVHVHGEYGISDGIFFVEDLFEYDGFDALMLDVAVASGVSVERMHNQARSLEIANFVIDDLLFDDRFRPIFPDYIGGLHLDDDGNLVIAVVGSEALHRSNSKTLRLSELDGVSLRNVEFSHTEIFATRDLLSEITQSKLDRGIQLNFNAVFPCIIENRVIVWLYEYNNEQIEIFRRTILDSPLILFTQSDGVFSEPSPQIENREFEIWDGDYSIFSDPCIDIYSRYTQPRAGHIINPGRMINVAGYGFSAGFRVRCVTFPHERFGFVTTLHNSGIPNNTLVRLFDTGQLIGVVHSQLFGGRVDAAFIRVMSYAVRTGNDLPDGWQLLTAVRDPIPNTDVFSVGAITGMRRNRVLAIDGFTIDRGVRIDGLIRQTIPHGQAPEVGDSGGAIWNQDRTTVGIHVGYQPGLRYIVATRAVLVQQYLRVLRY